jgi:hypothetical protein
MWFKTVSGGIEALVGTTSLLAGSLSLGFRSFPGIHLPGVAPITVFGASVPHIAIGVILVMFGIWSIVRVP